MLDALSAAYERWDGKGWPGVLEGEQVPIAARLANLAEFMEVAHRLGGPEAAKELARQRRGEQFDPALADALIAGADALPSGLDESNTWDAVIDAEPALAIVVAGERSSSAVPLPKTGLTHFAGATHRLQPVWSARKLG